MNIYEIIESEIEWFVRHGVERDRLTILMTSEFRNENKIWHIKFTNTMATKFYGVDIIDIISDESFYIIGFKNKNECMEIK